MRRRFPSRPHRARRWHPGQKPAPTSQQQIRIRQWRPQLGGPCAFRLLLAGDRLPSVVHFTVLLPLVATCLIGAWLKVAIDAFGLLMLVGLAFGLLAAAGCTVYWRLRGVERSPTQHLGQSVEWGPALRSYALSGGFPSKKCRPPQSCGSRRNFTPISRHVVSDRDEQGLPHRRMPRQH